jgi:hypothetical protein
MDLRGRPDGRDRTYRGCRNYDFFRLLRVAIIYTFLSYRIETPARAWRNSRTAGFAASSGDE